MTLRNGKVARPDRIPVEATKADIETMTSVLHSLFSKIWEKEEVSAQWREWILIKLPKKGDLRAATTTKGSCVSARQSAQQNHIGEGKGGSRPQAPRPAGRLPQKQNMRESDCQPTHHSGAVDSVELHPLHQFH